MRHDMSLGLAAAMAFGAVPTASAQDVAADIHIRTGPVAGVVRIGERPHRYHLRPRAVVVERHYYPRPVRVEIRRGRAPWHDRGWRKKARVISVYYDRHCNTYFDRYRRGFERIRVVNHDGRFYRYDDDRHDGYYDRRHDRDWDGRHDRRDRDDRDDRHRRDHDYGSWEHDHE